MAGPDVSETRPPFIADISTVPPSSNYQNFLIVVNKNKVSQVLGTQTAHIKITTVAKETPPTNVTIQKL